MSQVHTGIKSRRARRGVTRRSVLVTGAGAGLAAFLAACGGSGSKDEGSQQSTTTSGAAAAGSKAPSGTVTVAVGEEPPDFDAHRAIGGVYSHFVSNVYNSLIQRDEKGKIVPALAESWTVSPDGKVYEFKLRQGVKFHNGETLTADDVVFSYQRLRNPKIRTTQSDWVNWEGVVAVDPGTVQFRMKQPDPTTLGFVASPLSFGIVPAKYVQQVGDDDFAKKPVGTGPYKFVSRRIKESWELEAFTDYWGGPPPVQKGVFRVIPEASTAEAALDTGEVDIVANYPGASYQRRKDTKGMRFIVNPASNTADIRINSKRQNDPKSGQPNPFYDKRVRQAMAYAIDKDAIIKNVLGGMGEKIAVLFTEDIGYDPNLKPYPYDPARAKQLLASAGYPNGLDADFYGLLGERLPNITKVGEAVAQYLTAVGIRTKVINEEYALWLKRTTPETDVELYPMGIGITYAGGTYHPAVGFSKYASCKGSTSWVCDSRMDELVQQMYTELDSKKVEEAARQAAQLTHDEAFVVILYRNVNVYGMKEKIEFLPTAGSQFVELKNVTLRS